MNERWTVSGDAGPAEKAAFGSLDAIFALEGEFITKDPLSRVLRVTVDGTRYYVKRYTRPGKNPLRYWFGRPRIRTEWENLLAFEEWGIPTARVVAHGLERHFGRFLRGALITEEIPATTDLAKLAREHDPRLSDATWVREHIEQVAHIARQLHCHGFAHNDFHWRNLLFRDDDGCVYLIDCPSGMHWPTLLLRYRVVKDLASLDKTARLVLRRTQRLRFLIAYLKADRLTPAGKRWVRAIDRAHRRRALRKRLGL